MRSNARKQNIVAGRGVNDSMGPGGLLIDTRTPQQKQSYLQAETVAGEEREEEEQSGLQPLSTPSQELSEVRIRLYLHSTT